MNKATLVSLNNRVSSIKKRNSGHKNTRSLLDGAQLNCLSAISPVAYLAELVDYATKHIKKENQWISLDEIETYFHQPFGQIPLNCQAVEEEVAQIRICLEVLRQHHADEAPNENFQAKESEYLNEIYALVLLKLNTSVTELESIADAEPEIRQGLANKLGVDESHLNELWKGDSTPTESWLEEVFGIKDTNQTSFEPGSPLLIVWKTEFFQATAEANFSNEEEDKKTNWLEEKIKNLQAKYAKTIREVEEHTLPILRSAFLPDIQTARRLSNELLINCEYDACFRTTRVSQAIATIQQLILSVRNGLQAETHSELSFRGDEFTEEWKWLGTYQSWHSAMMVFLYPENVLNASLRQENSPVLQGIIERLRKERNLTRELADGYMQKYRHYFEDICNLKLEASCQTAHSDDIGESVLFLFGRYQGKLYYATYADEQYMAMTKIPLPETLYANKVAAAVPFRNSKGERTICLFFFSKQTRTADYTVIDPNAELEAELSEPDDGQFYLLTYSLHTKKWADDAQYIPLPGGGEKVCLERRVNEKTPPRIYVLSGNSNTAANNIPLYFNDLKSDGTGLAKETWDYISFGSSDIFFGALSIGPSRFIIIEGNSSMKTWKLKLEPTGYHLRDGVNVGLRNIKNILLSSNSNFYLIGESQYTNDNHALRAYSHTLTTDFDLIIEGNYFSVDFEVETLGNHQGVSIEQLKASPGFLGGEYRGPRFLYLGHQSSQNPYEHAFLYEEEGILKLYRPNKIIPFGKPAYVLNFSHASSLRRSIIEEAWLANDSDFPFGLKYLWERFYFLPKYIAQKLQRSRQYADAKDYYRLVYDYSLPLGERKIFYGLQQEDETSDEYQRNNNWLLDPLNPHALAPTRQNAYSEYTIQSIVRCLLEEADAAFTKDTVESLSYARSLYQMALDLLANMASSVATTATRSRSISPNPPTLADVLINRTMLLEKFSEDRAEKPVESSFSRSNSTVENLLLNINSFEFSIPENPVWQWLKLHAEVNLFKINTCRNIAGDDRPVPALTTAGSEIQAWADGYNGPLNTNPASSTFRPTPFRYTALIERAKQITSLAQQIETSFLNTLEKMDAEQLSLINAQNDLQISKAGIRLQDLRLKEAGSGVKLAGLQTRRSEIQRNYFQELLAAGYLESERKALDGLIISNGIETGIKIIGGIAALNNPATALGGVTSIYSGIGSLFGGGSTNAEIYKTKASYERRAQNWQHQLNLSSQDIRIGEQQERIAQNQVEIVNQERNIATIRSDQAETIAEFLSNKFTNAELYDWMSEVLEGVYSFFLQQATATAQLAAQQLAFERQEPVPSIILSDYWETPKDSYSANLEKAPDRRGLTGSARLLQDIYQLDQFAFQTDRRKLQMTKTISLASLSPVEFQQFRESGLFPFYTPMNVFDRDFPGHYLRLIKRIRISVIALVPPVEGIKATLGCTGISRVVQTTNGTFSTTEIKRRPESIALTSTLNATGVFDFEATDQVKLRPFESMGVESAWEFQLPKGSNLGLDYNTIADILLTIDYTALHDDSYKQQVLEQMDNTFSADRVYSFRNDFPDQWYDLHHPELVDEANQMAVQFDLLRADFPPNLSDIKVKHITLYLPHVDDEVVSVSLNREGQSYPYKSQTTNSEGIVSSRQAGNMVENWQDMLSISPEGQWTLSFPNEEAVRQWFKNEKFRDILLVITFEGLII